MSLITQCPHCEHAIHLPANLMGRTIQCRRCLGALVVGGVVKTPSVQRLGTWEGKVSRFMNEMREELLPTNV
jgi:hypothetical protein